ncbi:unnamed protein product [Ectocarpus sp. CCAP 1310/34]|nr:unnamed protein product [Ectocarpus sp. CCAP 1310/34]
MSPEHNAKARRVEIAASRPSRTDCDRACNEGQTRENELPGRKDRKAGPGRRVYAPTGGRPEWRRQRWDPPQELCRAPTPSRKVRICP